MTIDINIEDGYNLSDRDLCEMWEILSSDWDFESKVADYIMYEFNEDWKDETNPINKMYKFLKENIEK